MKKNSKAANQATDLKDSGRDKEITEPETVNLNLPDVKDIPGQENITPAPPGEMADETVSSADEEGDELFEDNIDDDIENDPDSNVSLTEKEDLEISANDMPTKDDINLREAALDNIDDDGTPLNEGSFKNNVTGADLDVPGAEEDDEDEGIGEEDEENNEYSLGGDKD
jgi:hypothetical protein